MCAIAFILTSLIILNHHRQHSHIAFLYPTPPSRRLASSTTTHILTPPMILHYHLSYIITPSLHQALSKYLTAQDTRFTPIPSKHIPTMSSHGSLLSPQSWSTIQVNNGFLSLVLSKLSQKLGKALSRAHNFFQFFLSYGQTQEEILLKFWIPLFMVTGYSQVHFPPIPLSSSI